MLEGISTNANPFERLVSRSRIMETDSTCPWALNSCRNSSSVTSYPRLPIYILKCFSFVSRLFSAHLTKRFPVILRSYATGNLGRGWPHPQILRSAQHDIPEVLLYALGFSNKMPC